MIKEQGERRERHTRLVCLFETLWQDLRFGARTLSHSPGFLVIAILSLGLGIGLATTAFTVLERVRLRALPYPEADRLVAIQEQHEAGHLSSSNYETFRDWQRRLRTVRLAAQGKSVATALVRANTEVGGDASLVSADMLPMLGIRPTVGRLFTPDDHRPGASPVVILRAPFWREYLNAAPDVIGQPLRFTDGVRTIVGVIETDADAWFSGRLESFVFPMEPALAARAVKPADSRPGTVFNTPSTEDYLTLVGQLAPAATLAQARAEAATLNATARSNRPANDRRRATLLRPLHEAVIESRGKADLFISAIAYGVLLIACANLANLLLIRTIGRQRELSVRRAIGAGQSRILRQLVTESLLIGVCGGALGMLVAAGLVPMLNNGALNLVGTSGLGGISFAFNTQAAAFAIVLTLVTAVFFTVAPALHIASIDVQTVLRESAVNVSGNRRRNRTQRFFVACEVGATCVLLTAAGMFARSYMHEANASTGYDHDRLLRVRVYAPDAMRAERILRELEEWIAALPDVERTARRSFLFVDWNRLRAGKPMITTIGRDGMRGHDVSAFDVTEGISEGFFQTFGIPLFSGRPMSRNEIERGDPVAVVSEHMARSLWPNESSVGKQFKFGAPEDAGQWYTVVGVARDAVTSFDVYDEPLRVFLPIERADASRQYGTELHVRSASARPGRLGVVIRRKALSLLRPGEEPRIYSHASMYEASLSALRTTLTAAAGLASCGLLLAIIGIYGVVAYAVTRRTNEIGIRMALGAQPGSVAALVVREGVTLTLAGLAAGIPASLALSRIVQALVANTEPVGALVIVGVTLIFLLVSGVATILPVRRALRVDPMTALRVT